MLRASYGKTRLKCEIYSKITRKTSEQCQWHRSSDFIINFEHISHIILVLPLLTLNKWMPVGLLLLLLFLRLLLRLFISCYGYLFRVWICCIAIGSIRFHWTNFSSVLLPSSVVNLFNINIPIIETGRLIC